ncbi:DNA polymerase/3'-5' exonuclease PolX [Candidatus Wolfebacteria bacterium]|nr:DNA polymerase/3'-5' exonuclease PolX [Candidatus Wolfebacteria bacterium]
MKISNSDIANILYEIAGYLEMEDVPFKPRAYEKAASAIEALDKDASQMYKEGGLKALEEIPGVGVSIAEKIEELIKTGKLKYYNELKKKTPVDLNKLMLVEGLGPKNIKKLYQELKIKNLGDLEKAAKAGKIRTLEGFGKKSEENILKGIEFQKQSGNRFILGFVMSELGNIVYHLKKLKEVERIDIVGSARRRKETIGDADILIISEKPKPVMDFFVNMREAAHVYAHGETKSAIKLKNGMDVDLRVVPKKSYGAAMQYFIGSKNHNVALREIAIKKGYKLNEYGLFKISGKKEIKTAGEDEKEIYEKLGMDWIPYEMRENQGEIELAQKHKLPKLVNYWDLKGDLQIQTSWTDGANTIEEYVEAAMEKGLEYICITDHTKRLAMTGGLDEKRLLEQMATINRINRQIANSKGQIVFKILKGSEVDILKDGTLDIKDEVLAKLDVVGASIHSYFNLSRAEQTKRMIKAMENKNVDIIFHPTGRIINRRPAYDIDIDEIIKVAKRTGTILEIDAFPDRADLKDDYIRKCVEASVKMAIDSDAHAVPHMNYLEWGIAQARRGWATKNDIINCWPLEKMLKMLK